MNGDPNRDLGLKPSLPGVPFRASRAGPNSRPDHRWRLLRAASSIALVATLVVVAVPARAQNNSGTLQGSDGANGAVGGGGMPGGTGLAATEPTVTNSGTITGGTGGAGGTGFAGSPGAPGSPGMFDPILGLNTPGGPGGPGGAGSPGFGGGEGGAGVTANAATISNSGTIAGGGGGIGGLGGPGGMGGAGGTGFPNGPDGPSGPNGARGLDGRGGAGVVGSDLTILNSGAIRGGLSGDGLTRASAILFTGGANRLTLQGAGWTIVGDIAVNGGGTLTFDQASAQTLGNVITGNGSVVQNGTGTLTLTAANTYTGATTISGGHLRVDGAIGGSGVAVNAGGTLSGAGSIGSAVTVNTGGTLSGAAGAKLTTGALTLSAGSNLNVSLGAPSVTELFKVNGDLALNGATLNVSNAGAFGDGLYRLIDYSGALSGAGLVIRGTPTGYSRGELAVQTAEANHINLAVASLPDSFAYWNGAVTAANGTLAGGAGTWSALGPNWTNTGADTSGAYDTSALLIFAGGAGTVVVDAGGGALAVGQGIQFFSTGYVVQGDGLAFGAGTTTLRVGDGTGAGAGTIATIASKITGTGNVEKTDLGSLVLTGANSWSGFTRISAGTLIGTTSSISGNAVQIAGGELRFDQANSGTFAAGITGSSGSIVVRGLAAGNMLTFSGNNSFAGAITVADGSAIALTGSNDSGARLSIDLSGASASVQVGAAGTVRSGGTVIEGNGTGQTVTNLGSITSVTPTGTSETPAIVMFRTHATVLNSGTISGDRGVEFSAANATLTNNAGGKITGKADSAVLVFGGGTVTNSGTIETSGAKGALYAGNGDVVVTNKAGGTIQGNSASAIQAISNSLTVDNAGTISGGWAIDGGGATRLTVTNSGTITGSSVAVLARGADAKITNRGTIAGSTATGFSGIRLDGTGATLTNLAGGTISGWSGVEAFNTNATLTNQGTITATVGNALGLDKGGTAVNGAGGLLKATAKDGFGIYLNGSGTANNAGTITADYGIMFYGTGTRGAVNSGTINAGSTGVGSAEATSAIDLVNSGTITVTGGAGVAYIAGGTVANTGTITGGTDGYGIDVNGASTISNQAGGRITGGKGAISLQGAAAMTVDLDAGSTTTGQIRSTGAGSRVINIKGTLDGGYMGGDGIDTISISTGASVSGGLDGGAGDDLLTLSGIGVGALGGVIANVETLTKEDAGSWSLTGISTYTGATNVNAGVLVVNGSIASSGLTTVHGGGTLTGTGSVGATTIAAGGTLKGAAGSTLTLGALTLGAGSNLDVSLGAPATSELFKVNGNLALNGATLNVANAGAFGEGLYRLIDYSGALSGAGLVIGITPAGFAAGRFTVQTSEANHVNLVVSAAGNGPGGAFTFWDGTNTVANGTVNGGAGTWSLAGTNWTSADATANGAYDRTGMLIFSGTGGMVDVDAAGTGSLAIGSGLQFADNGYVVRGDGLTLGAGTSSIRVGDGTAAGAGYTATIASAINGAGGLDKTDLGVLVLSGANTYAGATNVNAGTLVVSGSIATSGLTIIGSGSTLTGTGMVGAATVLAGGTLKGTAGSTLTLGNLSLSAGSNLDVSLGAPSTTELFKVSGNLALNGATLNVADAGGFGEGLYRLIDYSGTLSGAGLVIGAAPAGFAADRLTVQTSETGHVNLVVAAGGAGGGAPGGPFTFWDGSNTVANGAVDGGAGTWSLAGTNWTNSSANANGAYDRTAMLIFAAGRGTVTVDASGAGSLSIGSGIQFANNGYTLSGDSLAFGSGTTVIRVGDGTAAGAGYTATITSSISGAGGLDKTDLGTLVFAGTNTYAGATNVRDGTLVVNGSTASAISVASGARLGGSGSIGGLVAGSGAVIAPGNSIGTLTVSGNVSFAAGSAYQVEVNPAGQADRIVATGTATISGGTVSVLAGSGNYAPSTSYTILTAAGGRTGTFDGVTSNLAFLTPSLSYGATAVTLTMARNDISFSAIGGAPNQHAVAASVESLGLGNELWDAIVQLDAGTARAAFDALSGETHASVRTVMIEESRFVRDATLEHLHSVAPRSGGIWGSAFGGWGGLHSDGNAARVARSSWGMLLGADAAISARLRAGAFFGYGGSDFDLRERRSSADSENFYLGAYAGGDWDGIRARVGGAFGWHNVDTTRLVAFPGVADKLTGDYHAATTQVFGELGYAVEGRRLAIEPFVGLAYVKVSSEAFTEHGSAAALSAKRESSEVTFSTLGARTSVELDGKGIRATGKFLWRHAFGEVISRTEAAFAGSPTSFMVAGVPMARDAAVIDAGLELNLGKGFAFGVQYSGQLGSGVSDHGGRFSFKLQF